jgi:hypothetical protein
MHRVQMDRSLLVAEEDIEQETPAHGRDIS